MIRSKNIGKILETIKKEMIRYNVPYVVSLSDKTEDPFKVLISAMLSARTKDEATSKASKKLFSIADTPSKLMRLSEKQIEELIFPVGFYKTKASRLKQVARMIVEKYNGKVPSELEKLLELPGVGRKTANLVLTLGFGKYGICVDTHVHRIVNRWNYVATKTPIETELALREKLPRKYWKIINTLLVAFGQTICKPISPLCSKCPISNYCPKRGVDRHR
jgi:endonuclease-3